MNQSDTMQQLFRQVFKNKVFVYCLRLNITLFFLTAGLLLYFWQRLPPVVPLFYSLPWGEKQLTNPWGLWGLLLGLLLLNLINFLLGGWLWRSSKYISYLLWTSSVILTCLGILTIFKIILLVG